MVGDSAFPSRPWLLKAYSDTTKNRKERYFNRKLRSARVVSEHAYGMLKGRFRFVYKKAECRRHNVKAVIIALHIFVLCGLIRVSHVGNSGWRDLI